MINIKPKTYNEILRLSCCLQIKENVFSFEDEDVEKIYNFLSQNPKNSVSITREIITYIGPSGNTEEVVPKDLSFKYSFDHILITYSAFSVLYNNKTPSSDSGCSGCSGCSTNNNNNNNNNNNG